MKLFAGMSGAEPLTLKALFSTVTLVAIGAFVALGGCSVDRGSEGSAAAGSLTARGVPCDVAEVLDRKCNGCHSSPPAFGAPMPLVTADDLHAPARSNPAKKVHEIVGTRIHDTVRPMPPSRPLDAPDMAIVDAWLAAGAPRSAATCADAGSPDGGTDTLPCNPDTTLAPPSKWTLEAERPDDYVCYGVEVTATQKRHAIAMGPKIDNRRVLHHLDVYEAPTAFPSTPQRCSAFGASDWRMVYAWAPGAKNLVLPPAAGFPISGTMHYVVQIHYSNVTHLAGEVDGSGVDICTTDQLRPNDADVMAFGSEQFIIPPRASYDLTCRVALSSAWPELNLFAVLPHMHGFGRSMTHTLHPRNGTPIELAKETAWDPNNQSWYPIDATLKPGDRVSTRCGWVNTTDDPVYFGDASLDEMCYAFTMYYPRIVDPQWNWSLPAQQAACTPSTQ